MNNTGTNLLWYKQPAASWNEALPLGNGRLGAMVFGDPAHERITLNEDTLWSGYPMFHDSPRAYVVYKQAQQLTMQGKNAEAQRLLEQQLTQGRQKRGDQINQYAAIHDPSPRAAPR